MRGKKSAALFLVLLAAVSLNACSSPDTGSGKTATSTGSGARPEYLPADFPIPDGASITLLGENREKGKKSAMLIYETRQSMDTVGVIYKEYVKDKHLPQDTQIVDSSNILINGKDEGFYSYSIIGSNLDAKPGTVEVIVGWVEN